MKEKKLWLIRNNTLYGTISQDFWTNWLSTGGVDGQLGESTVNAGESTETPPVYRTYMSPGESLSPRNVYTPGELFGVFSSSKWHAQVYF